MFDAARSRPTPQLPACRLVSFFGALLLATCGFASSLRADDLLETLRENGTITEEQYVRLQSSRGASTEIRLDRGGLHVNTPEGLSFRIGGRLHVQFDHYREDEVRLGDGGEVRRARVEIRARFTQHWGASLQLAADRGDASVKTAAVSYSGFSGERTTRILTAGQFREPFSLTRNTSTNHTPLIERPAVFVLAPSRAIGVGARGTRGPWTIQLGVFGEGLQDDANDEGDEGYAATGRLLFAPIADDDSRRVIHVGVSGSFRVTGDDRVLRLRTRPEAGVTNVRFLDTGNLTLTRDFTRFGAEAAVQWGPVRVIGEWIGLHAHRTDGGRDPLFQGGYVTASWTVTGESRRYRVGRGVFTNLVPNTDRGAWELVGRVSYLDLNNAGIKGGTARSTTFGVNYYPITNVRFAANLTFVDHDQHADGNGTTLGRDDPQIAQFRVQVHF